MKAPLPPNESARLDALGEYGILDTLEVAIDDEAFDRLYGFRSHPITAKKGSRVAVRVVSQLGEESTKVLSLA